MGKAIRGLRKRRQADRCFPAISGLDAETLLLGSLPGQRSLAMQQYYAHPQNAFWKLIAAMTSVARCSNPGRGSPGD